MPTDKKTKDAYYIEEFSKLPEPYASIAKLRRTQAPLNSGTSIPINVERALMHGFLWESTPEGHAFWEKVHKVITKGKLKNLPRKDSHGRPIANWTQTS